MRLAGETFRVMVYVSFTGNEIDLLVGRCVLMIWTDQES